jgi:predicted RNase H-like nuclease (RuvC/YqgF family)
MQEIPNWRIGRKHIYEELKVLGVTPNTLNAAARAREKQETRRKKEEAQDIRRMVKHWRRHRKKGGKS